MATEMTKTGLQTRSGGRNGAIECCRLVASVFVVFIHYTFPGKLGAVMDCLARFAVPFFFMVSGYFAYQADETTIKKRAIGILKLDICATVFYFCWGLFRERYILHQGRMAWLMLMLPKTRLAQWPINGMNPFGVQLWYLDAAFMSYVVLYLYVRWKGKNCRYDTLYLVSVLLYAVHFMMSSVASVVYFEVPSELYRNALFFGLPMLSLGMFLREYQNKILETYHLSPKKLLLIAVLGAGFSVVQWWGTGKVEMPLGTLFEVIALLLLCVSVPTGMFGNRVLSALTSKFGALSTYVFLSHVFWNDIYQIYIMKYFSRLGGTWNAYLWPAMVALLSVGTGAVWVAVKAAAGKHFRRARS